MRSRLVLLTLLALYAGLAAYGEEPALITDRPDRTESAHSVPRGLFQVEGGWGYGQRGSGEERVEFQSFPEALLRIGLSDGFELRIGVPGFSIVSADDTVRGLVDATLGFKVVIAEERGAWPRTAFLGTLLIPSGDDEFSSDRVDPAFRFAFSNTLSQRVSLGYNLGMFWLTEPNDQGLRDTRSFLDWTVVAGIAAGSRLGVFAEAFGFTGASDSGAPANAVDGGVTYLITPRLQVDGTVSLGLSKAAPDWTVGLGASYRFPRFKDRP